MTRRSLLAAATATVLASAIAPLAVARTGTLANVDIYDRGAGEVLTEYRHRGQRYVAGEPGNEYAIRIRNCSDRRLLAVVSVDGINAVTGETASPAQSGYVLEPGGYVTVQGWRKDLGRTAAFYFADPGDSYAARTDRPNDLGVIGVALFRERHVEQPAWLSRDRQTAAPASEQRAEADAAGAAKARRATEATASAPAMPQPSLGTGHGRGEYSPVQQVEFERASARPDQVIAIRYERRETLLAMGVIPQPRYGFSPRRPDPFPGAASFVPDP
ncbi:MAG: hypothetical protein IPF50_15030 [Proteobacteria bacterium]|nr:hypothetical protein [Pseudomonadota bacterium]